MAYSCPVACLKYLFPSWPNFQYSGSWYLTPLKISATTIVIVNQMRGENTWITKFHEGLSDPDSYTLAWVQYAEDDCCRLAVNYDVGPPPPPIFLIHTIYSWAVLLLDVDAPKTFWIESPNPVIFLHLSASFWTMAVFPFLTVYVDHWSDSSVVLLQSRIVHLQSQDPGISF